VEEAGILCYSNDDTPKRAEIAPHKRVRIVPVTLTYLRTDKRTLRLPLQGGFPALFPVPGVFCLCVTFVLEKRRLKNAFKNALA